MVDPIADMLTQIRNALAVKKGEIVIPLSGLKLRLAEILQREGYIQDHQVVNNKSHQNLKIVLKYTEKGAPAIKELVQISKTGRRVYRGYRELRRVKRGLGIAILSTPAGLMTDLKAKNKKLGGEVICEVF